MLALFVTKRLQEMHVVESSVGRDIAVYRAETAIVKIPTD